MAEFIVIGRDEHGSFIDRCDMLATLALVEQALINETAITVAVAP
jgi:hypothetical protein